MSSVVRQVFIITGIMMLSLVLFTVLMGDTGRERIWNFIEPTFEKTWETHSFNDGQILSNSYNDFFNNIYEEPSN